MDCGGQLAWDGQAVRLLLISCWSSGLSPLTAKSAHPLTPFVTACQYLFMFWHVSAPDVLCRICAGTYTQGGAMTVSVTM
jgi:hypothetical protein